MCELSAGIPNATYTYLHHAAECSHLAHLCMSRKECVCGSRFTIMRCNSLLTEDIRLSWPTAGFHT